MGKYLKLLLSGFVAWLVPFIAGFALFGIHETNRILFEAVIPVVVALAIVLVSAFYFKGIKTGFLKESVLAGLSWLAIGIALDLAMFVEGPMKMSFNAYMEDIGVTYLMIPVIVIGFGWLLENRK